LNGDLENLRSDSDDPLYMIDDYPADWLLLDEEAWLLDYAGICEPDFIHDTQGAVLTTWEKHSGQYAFKGWIRPFTEAGENVFEAGRRYNAPGRYKALRQTYDWSIAPRIANPFKIKIYPNPVNGKDVSILCERNDRLQKHISISNAQGILVYSNNFSGNVFKFTEKLKPGIYFVKVTCHEQSDLKKLVVTN